MQQRLGLNKSSRESRETDEKVFCCFVVGIGLACTAAHAADVQKLDNVLMLHMQSYNELMATPDKGIPMDIAAKAHCVAVIPGYKRERFWSVHSTAKALLHAVPARVGARLSLFS